MYDLCLLQFEDVTLADWVLIYHCVRATQIDGFHRFEPFFPVSGIVFNLVPFRSHDALLRSPLLMQNMITTGFILTSLLHFVKSFLFGEIK